MALEVHQAKHVEAWSKRQSRSEKKKRFQRLVIAHSDIVSAYDACKIFLETFNRQNYPLQEALVAAIVICYTRPFVQSRRSSLGQLPKEWSMFGESRFQKAHEFMLKARNEIVAHSDKEVKKITITPPNVSFARAAKTTMPISEHIGFGVQTYQLSPKQVKDCLDACIDLSTRMLAALENQLHDLYGGMELPNRKFDLRINEGL